MTRKPKEYFTSRTGLVLAMIGTAVGAGNIWRFSRIAAQYGGGSFIIPWALCLFLWSIPLIIAELAMGKLTRRAPIGAMAETIGKRFGWLGGFIALVTTGILAYYSVVVAWGLQYFLFSVTGKLTSPVTDHVQLWHTFSTGWQPVAAQVAIMIAGTYVIHRGIVQGIEKANKILMPILFVIILTIAVRALTLPGAMQGVEMLFTPHWPDLLRYDIWIEALTQNAWDTGAGWGFFLVYGIFVRRKESVVVNSAIAGFSNNAVSLLMGMTIFGAIFALAGSGGIDMLIFGEGSTNTGLAFIYLPQLFLRLPGGPGVQLTFASLFFLAFTTAALSSMIAMLQVTKQVLSELGVPRVIAVWGSGFLGLVIGLPSALYVGFFNNQDWVWGVGLIINGLIVSIGVLRYGLNRYRQDAINLSPDDAHVGKWYNGFIGGTIPTLAVILIFWSLYQSGTTLDPKGWWNPFRTYSVGTMLFQWGLGALILLCLNRWLVKKTFEMHPEHRSPWPYDKEIL